MPLPIGPKQIYDLKRHSDDVWETPRRLRREHIQDFVGRHYARDGDGKRRPLNLQNRGARVMLAYLAGQEPTFQIQPNAAEFAGQCRVGAALLNLQMPALGWINTFRMTMMDALASPCGILRTGRQADDGRVALDGRQYSTTKPYLRRVSPDDYVTDVTCRYREQRAFDGDVYIESRKSLLERGTFRRDIIERLPSVGDGESNGNRLSNLTGRMDSWSEELDDMVELMDVAIYSDGVTYIATLPAEEGFASDFLKVYTYSGVGRGPYEFLEFFPIPDQPYGLPWMSIARDQAEIVTDSLNRMADQVARAKNTAIASRGVDQEEIAAIRDAEDDEIVTVDDVSKWSQIQQGGFSPEINPFVQQMIGSHDLAMATDILSGTSKKQPTATQYNDQSNRAGIVMSDPEATTYRFVAGIGQRIYAILQSGATQTQKVPVRLPNGRAVTVEVAPEMMQLDMSAATFKVVPRSMRQVDDAIRSRRLNEFMAMLLQATQVQMASMQMVPGGMLDLGAIARVGRDEFDLDTAEQFIRDPGMMAEAAARAQLLTGQPGIDAVGSVRSSRFSRQPNESPDRPMTRMSEVVSDLQSTAAIGAA